MKLSDLPRHFTSPIKIEGVKTNYLAVPTYYGWQHFNNKNAITVTPPIKVTSYQLRRIDKNGNFVKRVRMSKKKRIKMRQAKVLFDFITKK